MTLIRNSLSLLLLSMLLTACGTNTRTQATMERAAAFAARGDHSAAAREYAAVAAASAESTIANPALLGAGQEWLSAGDTAAADAALARLLPPLDSEQTETRDLLLAELALRKGEATRGWELLTKTKAPQSAARLDAYHALRVKLALATNRPLQAIRSHIDREAAVADPASIEPLRREFLQLLVATIDRGVTLDPRTAGRDALARGWLEAAPLAARAARAPAAANAGITAAWRKRYPDHAAAAALAATHMASASTTPDQASVAATPGTPAASAAEAATSALVPSGKSLPRGAHVAVLLPLSGRNATAGTQLRDGILAAHFAEPDARRTPVRFYDTARQSVTDALAAASRGGAVFVIGPLVREEVVAAATVAATPGSPPMLALNALPADHPAVPAGFHQFALSPEDEARAVARRALAEGRRRAVVLVPAGDWGARVQAAFREELEAGGGAILANETLGGREVGPVIQAALRIDDSIARHRRVQAALDAPLAFQPRRRADVDFLFMPAQAASLRQWRPQLRFQGAGELPTYATSDAWDGRSSAELAGVIFPDMDWMISGNAPSVLALRSQTDVAFGDNRGRGRLYALGHDAWLLQAAIRRGQAPTAAATLSGATGALSIDAKGRVHRSLLWAEIDSPIKLLPPVDGG